MNEEYGIGLSRTGQKVHAITRDTEPRTLCGGRVKDATYDDTLLGLPSMLRCGTCEKAMQADHAD